MVTTIRWGIVVSSRRANVLVRATPKASALNELLEGWPHFNQCANFFNYAMKIGHIFFIQFFANVVRPALFKK